MLAYSFFKSFSFLWHFLIIKYFFGLTFSEHFEEKLKPALEKYIPKIIPKKMVKEQ